MLSEVLLFLSQYLTLCGDIQLMLAQNANNRAAHLEEFNYQTKEDQEILHSLHRESPCQGAPARPVTRTGLFLGSSIGDRGVSGEVAEMLAFQYCGSVVLLS